MILGMSTQAFTLLHVILSLVGIGAGFIAIFATHQATNALAVCTCSLSITTALTSITGFLFPFHGVTPGIVLGILSLIVLLLADDCPLRRQTRRRMARNLCICRGACVVVQRLCAFCATVRESPGAQSYRAHAIVAGIRDHTARRVGGLPGDYHSGVQGIPPRVGELNARIGFATSGIESQSIAAPSFSISILQPTS